MVGANDGGSLGLGDGRDDTVGVLEGVDVG